MRSDILEKIYTYITSIFSGYSRARSFPSKRVFQKVWKFKKIPKKDFS